jgi:hypothetical protein
VKQNGSGGNSGRCWNLADSKGPDLGVFTDSFFFLNVKTEDDLEFSETKS